MSNPATQRPLTDLFGSLLDHGQRLLRNEYLLARTEMRASAAKLSGAGVMMVTGLALVLPAGTVLLAGIALMLTRTGLALDVALLAIGLGVALVGVLVAYSGLARAKKVQVLPEKALHQLKKDVQAVTEKRSIHEHATAA